MVERFQMKTEHDWVCARPDPKGDWVRFSDYEAVRAELEQARRERDDYKRKWEQACAMGQLQAEAAERLAGARVVTDAMVEAALKSLHSNPVSWEHPETIRAALTAALAEPAGDAEPLPAQIERLASFIMEHVPGEPSQSEGAVDCAIRIIRNSLYTPPDASAIREALDKTHLAEIIYSAHGYDPAGKTENAKGEPYGAWAKAITAAHDVAAALAGAKP